MHKNPGGNRNSGLWYETFGHPVRLRRPKPPVSVRLRRPSNGNRHRPPPRACSPPPGASGCCRPKPVRSPSEARPSPVRPPLKACPAAAQIPLKSRPVAALRTSAAAQSSSGHGHGRPVSRNVGRMPPTSRRYLPSSFESRSTTSGCSSATSCFSEMSFGMSNSSLRPVS